MSVSSEIVSATPLANPQVTSALAPASEWGDLDLSASTSSSGSASEVFSYVFTAQNTQHVNYTATPLPGKGAHVYELWYSVDQGWHWGDLTEATNAPAGTGNPRGYMFDAQGTHVNYRGTDGNVYELWWDSNGWHYGNLTSATGAPLAAGDPRGYMFDAQGTQHVNYRGADDHIYELWWDSNGWHQGDLTVAASAPMAAGEPFGYMFDAQTTQHVVYLGGDKHIHELWWDASGWHHNDLTFVSNATPAFGDPSGYVFTAQATQHVHYRGIDNHIHELQWDSVNNWQHFDLSAITMAPNALANPFGYVYDSQGTRHVNYRGVDDHIHELLWDSNTWTHNDVTATAGAPVNAGGSPFGCVFAQEGWQQVFYRGSDSHVHEFLSPISGGTGPIF